MKKEFLKDYIKQNCGCYSNEKIAEYLDKVNNDIITIDDILNSEIPLRDKYWFVIKKTELSINDKKQIAIDVAEMVLPIYENKYPDSKAPREAIEAAKLYLAGHISIDELLDKRKAAYAA